MNSIPKRRRMKIPVFNSAEGILSDLHERALVKSRIKVPGGWVVVCSTLLVCDQWKGQHEYTLTSQSTSAVFVADPEHKWLGDDVPDGGDDA